jgi:hypothetical protein
VRLGKRCFIADFSFLWIALEEMLAARHVVSGGT